MDILYIVGNGSKWNNAELRYSLRSISMFGKNIDRVFVCGHDTGVLSDAVTFIPCEDKYDMAHKNIMYKVLYAVQHSDISDHFLLSSDDHFYLRGVDFNNYPFYFKGDLTEYHFGKSDYSQSLRETKELLLRHGLPTFMCNPHCNTHITKSALVIAKDILAEAMELPHGGELNCILGNLYIQGGVNPVFHRDVKVRYFENKWQLLNLVGENHCISIYDESINCGINDFLKIMFPNPCKYEKDNLPEIENPNIVTQHPIDLGKMITITSKHQSV